MPGPWRRSTPPRGGCSSRWSGSTRHRPAPGPGWPTPPGWPACRSVVPGPDGLGDAGPDGPADERGHHGDDEPPRAGAATAAGSRGAAAATAAPAGAAGGVRRRGRPPGGGRPAPAGSAGGRGTGPARPGRRERARAGRGRGAGRPDRSAAAPERSAAGGGAGVGGAAPRGASEAGDVGAWPPERRWRVRGHRASRAREAPGARRPPCVLLSSGRKGTSTSIRPAWQAIATIRDAPAAVGRTWRIFTEPPQNPTRPARASGTSPWHVVLKQPLSAVAWSLGCPAESISS